MKYNVHLYRTVRVKICGIEADNHPDAIEKAEEEFHKHFQPSSFANHVGSYVTEDAEETTCFLVDEEGDEEYENTRWYCADGKTDADGRCVMCARNTEEALLQKQTIEIGCYGIVIELDGEGGGQILASDLKKDPMRHDDNIAYNAAMDALESTILAHACAWIDVCSPEYLIGLQTTVEACADNL